MQKAGDLEKLYVGTSKNGSFATNSVSRQNSYGYDLFIAPTFATFAPVVAASTAWNATSNIVTATAHGMFTGQVVQVTTTGGLPSGVSGATDYWIIKLTADTFALATTLANALAGTKLALGTAGTGDHTCTKQADVATFIVQVSPNNVESWATLDSMSAVSIVGVTAVHKHFETSALGVRGYIAIAKGCLSTVDVWLTSKG